MQSLAVVPQTMTIKALLFLDLILNKCEDYGIELVEADKFYPSSKLCHECGHKKVDLKLSVHTYHCDKYGYTAGRDYNASVNLASYSV